MLASARADAIVDIWIIGGFRWFAKKPKDGTWIELPIPKAKSLRLLALRSHPVTTS